MVSLFPKEQTVEVTRGERFNTDVNKMKSVWGRDVEMLRCRCSQRAVPVWENTGNAGPCPMLRSDSLCPSASRLPFIPTPQQHTWDLRRHGSLTVPILTWLGSSQKFNLALEIAFRIGVWFVHGPLMWLVFLFQRHIVSFSYAQSRPEFWEILEVRQNKIWKT